MTPLTQTLYIATGAAITTAIVLATKLRNRINPALAMAVLSLSIGAFLAAYVLSKLFGL